MFCLKPDLATITICTMTKRSSATEAKKWIVRADSSPKNMSNSTGCAAVIAGDIVMPVKTISGSRKNITTK